MAMRKIAFVIIGLTLGGCMQETLEPSTQVGWNARDKQLMSNLPYAQASIPDPYRRHIVEYTRKEAPGSIVVDSDSKFLYYVLPKGEAIRYGIAVGEDAQVWSGIAKVGRMEQWPAWVPTSGEQARLGSSPAVRIIRWVRVACTCIPAIRTRFTASTAPISLNISARRFRRAASG